MSDVQKKAGKIARAKNRDSRPRKDHNQQKRKRVQISEEEFEETSDEEEEDDDGESEDSAEDEDSEQDADGDESDASFDPYDYKLDSAIDTDIVARSALHIQRDEGHLEIGNIKESNNLDCYEVPILTRCMEDRKWILHVSEAQKLSQNAGKLHKRLTINGNIRPVYLRMDRDDPDLPAAISFKRPQNIEAVLGWMIGEHPENDCMSCQSGTRKFPFCIIVPGMFGGACVCCHFSGEGTACSFRKGSTEKPTKRRKLSYKEPEDTLTKPKKAKTTALKTSTKADRRVLDSSQYAKIIAPILEGRPNPFVEIDMIDTHTCLASDFPFKHVEFWGTLNQVAYLKVLADRLGTEASLVERKSIRKNLLEISSRLSGLYTQLLIGFDAGGGASNVNDDSSDDDGQTESDTDSSFLITSRKTKHGKKHTAKHRSTYNEPLVFKKSDSAKADSSRKKIAKVKKRAQRVDADSSDSNGEESVFQAIRKRRQETRDAKGNFRKASCSVVARPYRFRK